MDRAAFDRMAEIDGEHWWFAARRRIVTALINAHAPRRSGMRILEVGCGTGSNLAMLAGFGDVDAVEPDDAARALAERRSGIAIKSGLLPDSVRLEDGWYDLIVLLDVLEHIPEDGATLKVLGRKLAPGGRILLTVPAAPWLWSAHDVAHHHQRRYTARSLGNVLTQSGFRTVHLTHFNTILFPLIVGARGINKLTGADGGDDAMPPRPLNRLLEMLFGAERYVVARGRLPFGVSIGAVAEPVMR